MNKPKIDTGRPIHFEYQELNGFTVVALDSKLSDYNFQPAFENGQKVLKCVDKTIKDCRNIDGCVYFHLGRCDDATMVRLIELFQKLKAEKGWKQQQGLIVPDHKFEFK